MALASALLDVDVWHNKSQVASQACEACCADNGEQEVICTVCTHHFESVVSWLDLQPLGPQGLASLGQQCVSATVVKQLICHDGLAA